MPEPDVRNVIDLRVSAGGLVALDQVLGRATWRVVHPARVAQPAGRDHGTDLEDVRRVADIDLVRALAGTEQAIHVGDAILGIDVMRLAVARRLPRVTGYRARGVGDVIHPQVVGTRAIAALQEQLGRSVLVHEAVVGAAGDRRDHLHVVRVGEAYHLRLRALLQREGGRRAGHVLHVLQIATRRVDVGGEHGGCRVRDLIAIEARVAATDESEVSTEAVREGATVRNPAAG